MHDLRAECRLRSSCTQIYYGDPDIAGYLAHEIQLIESSNVWEIHLITGIWKGLSSRQVAGTRLPSPGVALMLRRKVRCEQLAAADNVADECTFHMPKMANSIVGPR
jgi:hypothetical protein